MASATAKPQKRLGDFLNEQQEPFMLEVYLLEREYSKGWSLNGDSGNNSEKSASCGLIKKRKALLPFCKVLTTLLNKLAFHSQSNVITRDYDQRKKHASAPQPEWVDNDHTVQFSSVSSSTVLNSYPDVDHHSFSSHISQTCNVCNMRWQQQQRCIEGSPESMGNVPLHRVPNDDETLNEDVGGMQQRIRSCGVLMPKKVTEDSKLSVAIWNLIGQSIKKDDYHKELREFLPGLDVSQILKSKRVSYKMKKLLFDYVRDITITLPTKDDRKQDCRQFMGALEVGKLIYQRTKEWGQYAGDGANLTCFLTMDYLNSTIEWSKFEPHVKDISVEITDGILESMNNEIVSEMIGNLTPIR